MYKGILYGVKALRMGLAKFLTGEDDLVESTQNYIRELATNTSPAPMADTNRMICRYLGQEYNSAVRDAAARSLRSLERPGGAEGVACFLNRRPAIFPRLQES